MDSIDLALWDPNIHRATALKDKLDMFAGDTGATLIPTVLNAPIKTHDVVFLSFDDCGEPVLETARAVRKSGEMTFILLVNDKTRDLTPLFRPKIRPSGVLYRPVKNNEIRDILYEIIDELDAIASNNAEEFFSFKSEGSTRRLPFNDILFFEANLKKICIHTKGQEISYYNSIDNLIVSLPKYFIRCHRSYIVNTRRIIQIQGVEMSLSLSNGDVIPFSRSYRDIVKSAVLGNTLFDSVKGT